MWRIIVACLSLLAAGPSHAQELIRLARIADIPDQYVGGEMLRAVYAKLNIKLEFEDVPGKRALALSSAGEVDGEIQRIGTLSSDYPTLIQVTPAINYIEPAVFATKTPFRRRRLEFDQGVQHRNRPRRRLLRGRDTRHGPRHRDHQPREHDQDARRRPFRGDGHRPLQWARRRGKLNRQARIVPLSPPLERIHIYHYLHERHRDLVPKVGKVIAQMEASGELATLREALVRQVLSAP
ncbi:polar amino acid transport system substrate-binding protein [Bradyrhizobium japonicum]